MTDPNGPEKAEAQHSLVTGDRPMRLTPYLAAMSSLNGSDLHLKSGAVPHIRVGTVIRRVKQEPLKLEEVAEMADELLNASQRQYLKDHGSIDLAFQVPDGDRFRLNIYYQRGETAIAARRVAAEIPDFQALHLPPIIEKVANEHTGLILLSGPTSCGKSTTVASMIEYINKARPCHIITIEDPIEFLYHDKKAFITQREIGIDTETFEEALRFLPRQDPDIVLIGEMRDRQTFQAALRVAETGHLVFGTVHAPSAAQTIGRIVELWPAESRTLIRKSLAYNLKAIICQRLLPTISTEFDRIPALEVMLAHPSVRQLIEEGRDEDLLEVIRSNERNGMRTLTRSLLELIQKNLVDPRVAFEVAPNADELKMMLKGISSEASGLIGGR